MAVETESQALVAANNSTPAELLRIAVSQNADIDKLAKLMDLQERWEKNEARKAFVVAMNAFKAEPPSILKNKHVHFDTQKGPTDYDHATLDHVCDRVIGSLSKHGISHRWRIEQNGEWIKVTCILTHELGHSEETTLQGVADSSGNKNNIQAIGSTVTYLQRYTLLAACGLAAANTDNDGGTQFDNGALAEQVEWIGCAKDLEELKKLFRDAYNKFEQVPAALKVLIAAKNKRKAELQ